MTDANPESPESIPGLPRKHRRLIWETLDAAAELAGEENSDAAALLREAQSMFRSHLQGFDSALSFVEAAKRRTTLETMADTLKELGAFSKDALDDLRRAHRAELDAHRQASTARLEAAQARVTGWNVAKSPTGVVVAVALVLLSLRVLVPALGERGFTVGAGPLQIHLGDQPASEGPAEPGATNDNAAADTGDGPSDAVDLDTDPWLQPIEGTDPPYAPVPQP